jgi:signal transduction histidine kinase
VHRAVNLLDGRARQHRVRICEHFSATPQIINGDPEQVHQVLVNLLVNGIEALPDGGELRVEVGRDEQSSDSCRVVISDSGPGIPADVLPRLFDPFVTTKKDGTGLGLAISRRIIDEHAGTIEAENCAGGGARFTVRLPFGAREPAAPPS